MTIATDEHNDEEHDNKMPTVFIPIRKGHPRDTLATCRLPSLLRGGADTRPPAATRTPAPPHHRQRDLVCLYPPLRGPRPTLLPQPPPPTPDPVRRGDDGGGEEMDEHRQRRGRWRARPPAAKDERALNRLAAASPRDHTGRPSRARAWRRRRGGPTTPRRGGRHSQMPLVGGRRAIA